MSKKTTISDADRTLFRNTIGKVQPLKDRSTHHNKHHTHLSHVKSKPFSIDLSMQGVHKLKSDDYQSYARSHLDKQIFKNLRTGKFTIDAILDLHGLNIAQAKTILPKFIHQSIKRHYRCVCIIHGKGIRSETLYPIMKNNVDSWLRQLDDVLAFCSALPKHGGTGAVYVLL